MSEAPGPRTPWVRAVWREPLSRFLALGALLFALYAVMNRGGNGGREGREILVTPGRIEQLASAFRAQRLRPPTREELDGLIGDHVRQEVLYREALRLGVDRDDVVIRRRLAQKMEFLQDDISQVRAPTESELERYLAEHAEDFGEPVRVDFAHLYFSVDRRGEAAAREAARLAAVRLGRAGGKADMERLADPTLLAPSYSGLSREEVGRLFGEEFADSLAGIPPDVWAGPIRSSYGYHAVLVAARSEPRLPPLSEVHGRVESEWRRAEKERANEASFVKLLRRYSVVIDTAGAGR